MLEEPARHCPRQGRGWLDGHPHMPKDHPSLALRVKLRRSLTFTHCCCLKSLIVCGLPSWQIHEHDPLPRLGVCDRQPDPGSRICHRLQGSRRRHHRWEISPRLQRQGQGHGSSQSCNHHNLLYIEMLILKKSRTKCIQYIGRSIILTLKE